MTHATTQDTIATEPGRATLAAGRPWAARWPDGIFTSARPGTGAPSGQAR